MKCLRSTILSAFLILMASACSSELDAVQEDLDLHGVIVQIDDAAYEQYRILVQGADKSSAGREIKAWIIFDDMTQLLKQEGSALRSVRRNVLKTGQSVRVWSSTEWMYSNPPQAGARRVVIDEE